MGKKLICLLMTICIMLTCVACRENKPDETQETIVNEFVWECRSMWISNMPKIHIKDIEVDGAVVKQATTSLGSIDELTNKIANDENLLTVFPNVSIVKQEALLWKNNSQSIQTTSSICFFTDAGDLVNIILMQDGKTFTNVNGIHITMSSNNQFSESMQLVLGNAMADAFGDIGEFAVYAKDRNGVDPDGGMVAEGNLYDKVITNNGCWYEVNRLMIESGKQLEIMISAHVPSEIEKTIETVERDEYLYSQLHYGFDEAFGVKDSVWFDENCVVDLIGDVLGEVPAKTKEIFAISSTNRTDFNSSIVVAGVTSEMNQNGQSIDVDIGYHYSISGEELSSGAKGMRVAYNEEFEAVLSKREKFDMLINIISKLYPDINVSKIVFNDSEDRYESYVKYRVFGCDNYKKLVIELREDGASLIIDEEIVSLIAR